MSIKLPYLRYLPLVALCTGGLLACGFDSTLRAYLDVRFWLPFAKEARHFEKKNVRRVSVTYAGMVKSNDQTPLAKLRSAYQGIAEPQTGSYDATPLQQALAAARSDSSLTPREKEEVDLIDAKIDMRAGQPEQPQVLLAAKEKLTKFLRAARTTEFLSEARGWLAHIDYLLGDQTAAGKIYLDELNRNGSNLSRETVLNSLRMNYGYDGGPELRLHLDDYFDTAEHAAFAISLVTNPHWNSYGERRGIEHPGVDQSNAQLYTRIQGLLEKHSGLLKSGVATNTLAMLTMRVALRMGDPPGALKIAGMVPDNDALRADPDFLWVLASAHFVSRDYAGAEQPLLSLFQSPRASAEQKAAAAYALCGVYQKGRNPVQQIRFALWLRPVGNVGWALPGDDDVYFAPSGWDLSMLLDSEAPTEALETFVSQYPKVPNVRLVHYALAVRYARADRYDDAAQIYQSINANQRAARMGQLAALFHETTRTDSSQQMQEAKYKMAEFLHAHSDGIYFNDTLWGGLQRYAMTAAVESRFTGEERQTEMDAERKLKDDQEERWRAYLMLRTVVADAGKTDLGRKAAQLGVRCLRRINTERFGREAEIRKADIELSKWLL